MTPFLLTQNLLDLAARSVPFLDARPSEHRPFGTTSIDAGTVTLHLGHLTLGLLAVSWVNVWGNQPTVMGFPGPDTNLEEAPYAVSARRVATVDRDTLAVTPERDLEAYVRILAAAVLTGAAFRALGHGVLSPWQWFTHQRCVADVGGALWGTALDGETWSAGPLASPELHGAWRTLSAAQDDRSAPPFAPEAAHASAVDAATALLAGLRAEGAGDPDRAQRPGGP